MNLIDVEPKDHILYLHPQTASQVVDPNLNALVFTPDSEHMKTMNRGNTALQAYRVSIAKPLRLSAEVLEDLYDADTHASNVASPRDYLGLTLLMAKRGGFDGVVIERGMVSGDEPITVMVPLFSSQLKPMTADEVAAAKIVDLTHESQDARESRSKDPLSAYMGLVEEVHTVMTDLTERVVNDHMGVTPDEINWSHVGSITEVLRQLQETRRFAGGPHANEADGATTEQKASPAANAGRRHRM